MPGSIVAVRLDNVRLPNVTASSAWPHAPLDKECTRRHVPMCSVRDKIVT
jgi:hypothetical protein